MSTTMMKNMNGTKQHEKVSMLDEVLLGLRKPQKTLPSKLFYDERGSELFDEITELAEYYPTRTESAIMANYIAEIAAEIAPGVALIEYGSGSSMKTRLLLDHLDLELYVPIDISGDYLMKTADDLRGRYPSLKIVPLHADYTAPVELPGAAAGLAKVAYFPGSTIGNFHPQEAAAFLCQVHHVVGVGGGLLIGVDLKKDPAQLHVAYNDAPGVTAAFNLNMLTHLNRALGANFDERGFYHHAVYNPIAGRIEMHLISKKNQRVQIADQVIAFHEGESIWTEVSYKYTPDEFAVLARKAGFRVEKVWVDSEQLFSVQYLVAV